MTATALAAEWRRLDLLGTCLNVTRQGKSLSEDLRHHLQSAQQNVGLGRAAAPWEALTRNCVLSPIDQDILACVLAPDADPRLGWMYQTLQPAISSAYPTPALIRELLFLSQEEAPEFHTRLDSHAPLLRHGLIEAGSLDVYQPLRPTARARADLLHWTPPPPPGLPGAVEIPVTAVWEDLVLPPTSLRPLREYLLWITCRQQVVNTWGARASGGPIALFAGPSGTGKSFAAEVVAGALGFRLFRVDLGLLVSKYVGETEKNITHLLRAAAGQPVVLLFDEAESLFGRRAEVRDARDRYANMEVSHLLTHIERHTGPCVLTTNLRQHLDGAFTRRFQVVIDFPRPDAAARALLWRRHLPPRAPLAAGVEYPLLADTTLTGGQIRNAALHAAYLAAGESVAISLKHLARAVWDELAKEGREIVPTALGALAAHLPESVR